MNTNHKVPKEVKDQVLARVKEGKDKIPVIAEQHGITPRTIYAWLNQSLDGTQPSWLELAKLKRENENLKKIIGQFVLEKDRGKKGSYGKTR